MISYIKCRTLKLHGDALVTLLRHYLVTRLNFVLYAALTII